MFWEVILRNNNLKSIDYLQIYCDNKNTPSLLWHPNSFYNNVQDKSRKLSLSLATSLKPKDMRIRARENI